MADRSFAKTCKRCGATDLRWVKSDRTGRFYLCQTTGGPGTCGKPLPFKPHKCPEIGTKMQVVGGMVEFTVDGWQFV